MAEENQVVEEVVEEVEEVVEEKNYCCEEKKDVSGNGDILDLLTEAAGYTVYLDIDDCECEENLKRRDIIASVEKNPDIDTTRAEQWGDPEFAHIWDVEPEKEAE